jgi:hypothetical protein
VQVHIELPLAESLVLVNEKEGGGVGCGAHEDLVILGGDKVYQQRR